jgi:hypothetical protein
MASFRQKDIKLLWGRAANLCSMCRQEVAHDGPATGSTPIGEQAHIVAEEDGGPRGHSVLTADERNSYPNLILLCPTCHTKIDKASGDYPIEKLHSIKTQHELWVKETLSARDTADEPAMLLYSHLVDRTVNLLQLEEWENWTSYAASPDMEWPDDASNRLNSLQRQVHAVIWPGKFVELETSIKALAYFTQAAFGLFQEHAERQIDGRWRAIRFYNLREHDAAKYHRLHKSFRHWSIACTSLMEEATKAANWFTSSVRRDLNPLFFLLKGRFYLSTGPYLDLTFHNTIFEYSNKETQRYIGRTDWMHKKVSKLTADYRKADSPESQQ